MTNSPRQMKAPFSEEAFIVLVRGLRRLDARRNIPVFVDIQLDLKCNLMPDRPHNNFHCDRSVWGYSIGFNQADHEGQVTSVDANCDCIRLQVQLKLNRDKWSETGTADYQIELKKQGNRLSGTFRGRHNTYSVAGRAFGILKPLTRPSPHFVSVQAGEHPRLLFRKQDLQALQRKARSPIGKKLVAALNAQLANERAIEHSADRAIGCGLLYQLQGNASAGELARKIIQRLIETPIALGPHDRPQIALGFAIAYDLVYEICDRGLRQQINNWLETQASLLLLGTDRADFNPTPWSNWNGMYRSALGMIALTLLGEPSGYPAAPIPPVMRPLNPPPQFLPGQGVPVNPLEPDRMPLKWLFVGPFRRQNQEDVLASIGGISKAAPQVGTAVTYRGITRDFQPLDPKYIWSHPRYTKGKPVLDVANPVDRAEFATAYYYTAIENDRSRWLRVGIRTRYSDAILYLAGQQLTEGDALYLEKGIYPLLVEAKIEPRSGWKEDSSLLAVEPRLIATTADAAKALHRERLRLYQRDRDRWQAGRDAYLAVGKIHPTAPQLNQIAARNIRRFLGTALGEWGWNSEGEHYTQMTMELVLPYVHAYRNVMGVELVPAVQLNDRVPQPQTNLKHFLPLYIAKSLYRDPASSRDLAPGVDMNNFGSGNRPLGSHLLALGFNTAAETYKPALLWVWNRLLGLERGQLEGLNCAIDLAFTLSNYPLELRPKHPSQVLPLAIPDRQKGGYIFRNRWQDENDIVAQIYLKSEPRRASWFYVGDGAFRIDGLGHSWVVKGASHRHQARDRKLDNVVQFSEPINGWLGGQTSHFQAQANGSGTVSINLDNAYLGEGPQKNGKRRRLADLSAHILSENTIDLGIRGVRTFAADYSGAAGVPALFAVVDRISGGGEKVWQIIFAREHRILIEGNVFTAIAADGATLKGTFIVPADVKLSAIAPQIFTYNNLKGEPQAEIVSLQGIQATSSHNFFVVMTLQQNTPPAVKVSGSGLSARVTIANQTLCFIEDKILVGRCKT